MKKTNKLIIGLFLALFAFVACEEDEKDPLNVHTDEVNIAPYVRIKGFQAVVAAGDIPTSSFEATVDVPRDNVASWDLSVSLESGGTTIDPVPIASINSFPSDISIPYTDIATALGITPADILGGDFIRFLGTATGTDGSTFTFENYSASITGQPEQLQAFNFIVLVKCSPITNEATVGGTWTLDLTDLYGDGWDGAFLTMEIDGVATNYTISAAQADAAVYNVDVPDGAQLIISYTSGAFEEEHVFSITSPDGPFGDFGPNPAPCVN